MVFFGGFTGCLFIAVVDPEILERGGGATMKYELPHLAVMFSMTFFFTGVGGGGGPLGPPQIAHSIHKCKCYVSNINIYKQYSLIHYKV